MDFLLELAKVTGPSVIAHFLGQGDRENQNQALDSQTQLAMMMAQLYQDQSAIDLPFRQMMLGQGGPLEQRMGQTPPLLQPGGMALSNPYQNVRRPGSPASGGLRQALLSSMRPTGNPRLAGQAQVVRPQ